MATRERAFSANDMRLRLDIHGGQNKAEHGTPHCMGLVQGEVTAEQLDEHCLASDTLARFKRPREYRFVAELPKSPSGKILRRMLRQDEVSA